jgi:hypothetical protein
VSAGGAASGPGTPPRALRRLGPLAAALLALGGGAAQAQTMLDQEERLVELHSLLVALPAAQAPGALAPGQGSLGLELITIPTIDGTTGGKVQSTASDQTRAFPRPRLALGLPAGGAFRAFLGLAYIPPIEVNRVSSHLGALEGGVSWTPGALAVALRAQAVYATSRSPVTEQARLDTLRTEVLGADLAAGYTLDAGPLRLTPFGGLGLVRVDGRFRVASDGAVLTSSTTRPALSLGLRAFGWRDLEAVAELVDYPGRLRHATFRLGWTPRLWTQSP